MNILVVGRHAEILKTVVGLLNSEPQWKAIGAITDDDAARAFDDHAVDLVLFGGGVEESSEHILRERFQRKNSNVKFIRHYGGGSGLLFGEIYEAMGKLSSI